MTLGLSELLLILLIVVLVVGSNRVSAAGRLVKRRFVVTNPVTHRAELSLLSPRQEQAMGRRIDKDVRRDCGLYDAPGVQERVQAIGTSLARHSERPELAWRFAAIDSREINAFAAPGGYVYIARGLLERLDDDDQLAAVLGHEIGHVAALHTVQRFTHEHTARFGFRVVETLWPWSRRFGNLARQGLNLASLSYSRENELQADRLGLEYVARSGRDPKAVLRLMRTLQRLQETGMSDLLTWLSSHPPIAERIAAIERHT